MLSRRLVCEVIGNPQSQTSLRMDSQTPHYKLPISPDLHGGDGSRLQPGGTRQGPGQPRSHRPGRKVWAEAGGRHLRPGSLEWQVHREGPLPEQVWTTVVKQCNGLKSKLGENSYLLYTN